MAFTAIDSAEIVSGKPVSTTTQGKIKDNFDDHESRLQVIESGTAVTYPPIIFRVNGPYYVGGAVNNVTETTINFPIRITGIRLIIDTAGSSGSTEVDVKFKRGAAAFTTLLTTKPLLSYTAGSNAISTNGVLDNTVTTLLAGDILRLDMTSVQTGGIGFLVRIDFVGA